MFAIRPCGPTERHQPAVPSFGAELIVEAQKVFATKGLSIGAHAARRGPFTVRKAFAKYIEYLESQGKQTLEYATPLRIYHVSTFNS
jgi:hypothetical protein